MIVLIWNNLFLAFVLYEDEMKKYSTPSDSDSYAHQLYVSFPLMEELIKTLVTSLGLPYGSSGVDAGCGSGQATVMLGEAVGPGGKVTGVDLSKDLLGHAERLADENGVGDRINYTEGDVTSLPFEANQFDWLFCKDTIYMIPEAVAEFARVVKPGGTVMLVFWSSQTFLPGYPGLESRLAKAFYDICPYSMNVQPDRHFLNGLSWLETAGLSKRTARCFAGSAHAPLSMEMKAAVASFLQMFYGQLEPLVTKEDWDFYQKLSDPESEQYILARSDYYCQFTYTLFQGEVPG